MLRLLQNVLSKRQQYLFELLLFVTICHLIVVGLFFLFYCNYHEGERFDISLKGSSSTIVFMPLKKKMDMPIIRSEKKKRPDKATKVLDVDTYLKKVKEQKSKQKVVEKKVAKQKKEPKHNLSLAKIKEEPPVVSSNGVHKNKAVIKKKIATSATKAVVLSKTKKIQPVEKKVSEKKQMNPQVVEQPVVSKAKKKLIKDELREIEQNDLAPKIKKQENKKQDDKLELEALTSQVELPEKQLQKEVEDELDDVAFVGYEQLDSLFVQNKIQKSVEQVWRPPVGMSKQISCEAAIAVGLKGNATKVTVVKSSTVLAYDTCARATLYKINYPKEVWGKEITIVLG